MEGSDLSNDTWEVSVASEHVFASNNTSSIVELSHVRAEASSVLATHFPELESSAWVKASESSNHHALSSHWSHSSSSSSSSSHSPGSHLSASSASSASWASSASATSS